MLSRFRYILLFGIMLSISLRSMSQLAMPDNVCIGAVKHYYVDPNLGSTYTWRINGVVQVSSTTNEIDISWNTSGTFLLEVQELSIDGCFGPIRSGQVLVSPLPTILAGLIVQPSCTVPTGSVVLSGLPPGNWTINPGAIAGTGTSTTISGLAAGTYNFTVTNEDGCTSLESADVVINEQPATPSAPAGSSTQSLCSIDTPTVADITATITGTGIQWYTTETGGTALSPTDLLSSVTYYASQTVGGCESTARLAVTVTINPLPGPAGAIIGPATYTVGSTDVAYSVAAIANATSYNWSYTGTGVTINGTGTDITLDFEADATSGQLTVKGNNICGDGMVSFLGISVTRSLNLTVYLEGIYNGVSGLVKVQGSIDGENSYDMFSGTVSDTLTVQLAQVVDPYLIVYTLHGVPINTDGTISLTTVPATLSGNYFIIIKHRNHIETWSQSVSFADPVINYNFTDAISKAWGDNMKRIGSAYCIYTGDTNGDQYVDGSDLMMVFINNKAGSFGYQVSDINGDGFVDGSDLMKVFINNKIGAGMNTPVNPLE